MTPTGASNPHPTITRRAKKCVPHLSFVLFRRGGTIFDVKSAGLVVDPDEAI